MTKPATSKAAEGSVRDGALAALTARMTRQEDAAFVEFLDTYRDRLFRYLIVITRGDEELTQEAMQQTMLRVVRHIRRFDDKDVFWSWLTRLARSAVTDHTRKKGRYFAFLTRFFNHQDAQKESSTNATEDPSLLDRLEELLPSLSTEDADLVKRKYYLGETSRTIAEQLGTTEKAIESRLVRIRRRLREMLLKEAQHE
ncbi:sigma-70 family RNA polymerase sigma factor [bacterium]|nr:sigma-70 family RNA polymerase sigma factor [bacterium]